jgi:hypothetical protein
LVDRVIVVGVHINSEKLPLRNGYFIGYVADGYSNWVYNEPFDPITGNAISGGFQDVCLHPGKFRVTSRYHKSGPQNVPLFQTITYESEPIPITDSVIDVPDGTSYSMRLSSTCGHIASFFIEQIGVVAKTEQKSRDTVVVVGLNINAKSGYFIGYTATGYESFVYGHSYDVITGDEIVGAWTEVCLTRGQYKVTEEYHNSRSQNGTLFITNPSSSKVESTPIPTDSVIDVTDEFYNMRLTTTCDHISGFSIVKLGH